MVNTGTNFNLHQNIVTNSNSKESPDSHASSLQIKTSEKEAYSREHHIQPLQSKSSLRTWPEEQGHTGLKKKKTKNLINNPTPFPILLVFLYYYLNYRPLFLDFPPNFLSIQTKDCISRLCIYVLFFF